MPVFDDTKVDKLAMFSQRAATTDTSHSKSMNASEHSFPLADVLARLRTIRCLYES